jgi:hypothetical protein
MEHRFFCSRVQTKFNTQHIPHVAPSAWTICWVLHGIFSDIQNGFDQLQNARVSLFTLFHLQPHCFFHT